MGVNGKLNKKFVESYKNKTVPWGPLGYITYKRTYSRLIDGNSEEWYQTVERCVNGILDLGCRMNQHEAELLYDYVFNLKCCFSGRALWQLGTKTIEKVGADSLMNCWHVCVNSINAFTFTFNELMLGGGVGFNIQPQYVYELPAIKDANISMVETNDCDFIVPDNREGWVKLLGKVLKSFLIGKDLTYSVKCIRRKGASISGFGGLASGPEALIDGISNICGVLKNRKYNKLRPIDCLDIMNIIGGIVVAGNVRRSAQIALGNYNDHDFIEAKNWKWYNVPNWRTMSNNTVVTNTMTRLGEDFWRGYMMCEPYGLFNLDNARHYGRIGEENYDGSITGVNPCAEIPLGSYESCNLAEIFLTNVNEEEFEIAAKLMYKVCKSISCIKHSYPETQDIIEKNRRIGISVTGYLQSKFINKNWVFDKIYKSIKDLDNSYSKKLGVNRSIRLTTVKPSGTLSLLAGCTSGVHPAYDRYYIRRIRFSSSDDLVNELRLSDYPIEPMIRLDGTNDLSTMVVSFPVKQEGLTGISAIEQIKHQLFLNTYWADNAVSCTVYFHPTELPEIKDWLELNYSKKVKTISFLKHQDHGFVQAPMESISRDEYVYLKSKIKQIGNISSGVLDIDCVKGNCPVK